MNSVKLKLIYIRREPGETQYMRTTPLFCIFLLISCVDQNKTDVKTLQLSNIAFKQALFIDAPEVMFSKIQPCTKPQQFHELKKQFKQFKADYMMEDSIYKYLEILNTLRDTSCSALLINLLSESHHPYIITQLLYALSQIKSDYGRDVIIPFLDDENDLIREYASNALGFRGNSADTILINNVLKAETNCYVIETLKAAKRRLSGQIPKANAIPYDSSFGINSYLLGSGEKRYYFSKIFEPDYTLAPFQNRFVYPHQQYKLMHDDHLYRKLNFGRENRDGSFHVGEDSGWELSGLPIHSITSGVVVLVMYEPSWGHLVSIETKNESGEIFHHYYGHLSENIDVSAGDHIYCGQKIGEIGPTWSVMNGGYRAHLHLGIAKGKQSETGCKGYYNHTDWWYNPVSFLYARIEAKKG